MSDVDSVTFQQDVDKIINEVAWETFQEDFEGFTEKDFKLASNDHICNLWDYLRKYGPGLCPLFVPFCFNSPLVARLVYEALLKEKPTEWTEAENMTCLDKEEFASYQISWLLDFDFGRKPQFGVFIPTFPSGPRPAATSSTSLTSPGKAPVSTSSASSTLAPVNASTILSSTTTCVLPPTSPTDTALATFASSSAFFTPSAPTPRTGPAPTIEHIINSLSVINPPVAMTIASTGHGRELSILAKTHTDGDEAKYSGRDDSFTYKLAIFHDICVRVDVPPEAKTTRPRLADEWCLLRQFRLIYKNVKQANE